MRRITKKPLTPFQRDLIEKNLKWSYTAVLKALSPLRLTLSDEDVESLGHIAIMNAARTYNPQRATFTSWIYWHARSVVHKGNNISGVSLRCISHLRHKRKKIYISETAHLEPTAKNSEIKSTQTRLLALEVISELPKALRRGQLELITRIFFHGESQEDIAQSMSLTRNAIAERLATSLVTLRNHLKKKGIACARRRVEKKT